MYQTRVRNHESILQDTLAKLAPRPQSLYEACARGSIAPSVPTTIVLQWHHGTRHASSSTFSCLVTIRSWSISHLSCPFPFVPDLSLLLAWVWGIAAGFNYTLLWSFLLCASYITLWYKEIFVRVGNVCWTHSPSCSGETRACHVRTLGWP